MPAGPSLAGHSLRMVRGGSTVVVADLIGQGGQGVVHVCHLGSHRLALKWLFPGPWAERQRKSLGEMAASGRPHPAFVWPIDLVDSPEVAGFGYVMSLLEPRFGSFVSLLNGQEPTTFRTMIDIARQLVDAFAALHASGLCYRDINFGNLRVDPATADIAIIDVDNVGLDGGDAFVKGTLRFMAPEVVRNETLPSTATDLYSLAVFLFYCTCSCGGTRSRAPGPSKPITGSIRGRRRTWHYVILASNRCSYSIPTIARMLPSPATRCSCGGRCTQNSSGTSSSGRSRQAWPTAP